MERALSCLLMLAAAAAAGSGCSDKHSQTGSGGASDASGMTSAQVTAAVVGSATGATTGAGPIDCSMLMPASTCNHCLGANCCMQVMACADDALCAKCMAGTGDHLACAMSVLFGSLSLCEATECKAPTACAEACDAPASAPSLGACVVVDGAKNRCNPVTNAGCNTAMGEVCDVASSANFECFPNLSPPNSQMLCQTCGPGDANKSFCVATNTCLGALCQRYCCTDADCGGTNHCTKTGGAPPKPLFGDPNVGVCTNA